MGQLKIILQRTFMKNKFKILALSILVTTSFTSFNINAQPTNTNNVQPTHTINAQPTPTINEQTKNLHQDNKTLQQEQEILMWLVVLNNNEISAAKFALKNNLNPNIKKYAAMMIKDHNKNLKITKKLLSKINNKSLNSSRVEDLKEKGKNELAQLQSTDKKELDKAYINAMVDGHQEALDTLDKDLANINTNSKIMNHLKTTRANVEHHLMEAKSIKENIK